MNIVFIGASQFGLRCLQLACDLPDVRIVGVVTALQVFSISYRPTGVTNVLHADIYGYAQNKNLPLALLRQRMDEPGLLDLVIGWQPDVFLVAGWYHMIPKAWRKIAPAYGLHASLLPDYSGGAPLVWAMINGETKTGITLFQMDDGVDAGPIASQSEVPIYSSDTIATLYARIEERGLAILREVMPNLARGTLKLTIQDESKRRVMPQRSPEDGEINWSQDADVVDRFIRAQTKPYPGAFSVLEQGRITIWSGQPSNVPSKELPGFVLKNGAEYSVVCEKGLIKLNEVTYGNQDYSKSQLCELFRGGGRYWAFS